MGHTGTPLDIPNAKETPVTDGLRRYKVTTASGFETEMLLNAKDAESYGDAATPVDGDAPTGGEEQAQTKAKTPANKARTTDGK